MIYIDKSRNRAEGEQVTRDYLQNCCVDATTGRYINVCYNGKDGHGLYFGTNSNGLYINRMVDVLLRNQSGYCCYCLRKLHRKPQIAIDGNDVKIDKVTIEHIIPRSYKSINCPGLVAYQQAPNLSPNDIILKDDFEQGANQKLPPFPHNVAYGNMVASCNGRFPDGNNGNSPLCCNEKRGEKRGGTDYVYPVYFHDDIQSYVIYGDDGYANILSTSYHHYIELEQLIKRTKLNNSSLRDIRRLWYELRKCSYGEIYKCDTEDKRHTLFSTHLLGLNIADKRKFAEKFKKDVQWHTFMLYRKFYTIMRQQHP